MKAVPSEPCETHAPIDGPTLEVVGDFMDRMRKLGASGARIGAIAVQFAPAPMSPPPRRGSGNDDETLFHSS